jgi:hypothetical protein
MSSAISSISRRCAVQIGLAAPLRDESGLASRFALHASNVECMALHLAAHTLSDEPRSPVTNVHLNADATLFASSTIEGWVIYQTNPLQVVSRKGDWADQVHRDLYACVYPSPLLPRRLVRLVVVDLRPSRTDQSRLPRRRSTDAAVPAQQGRPLRCQSRPRRSRTRVP